MRVDEDTEAHASRVAKESSGSPVPPPESDQVAGLDCTPMIDAIAYELPDGRTAIMGYGEDGDSYGFYLPDKDGGPDYDRPVDPDTGELLTPSRDEEEDDDQAID